MTVVRLKNPDFVDSRICECGHTYARHFDQFEPADEQDVGCKYCPCEDFVEASASSQVTTEDLW